MHDDLFGFLPNSDTAPAGAPIRGGVALDARSGDAALSQWFTPFWAAEEFVDDVLRAVGRDVSFVEPSCGTGAFLSAIPKSCPAFGVDIDPSVVHAAKTNSGRDVLVGDFCTVDLLGRTVEAVIGNPPFEMGTIEGFLDRSYQILPQDGLVALLLPAYAFQTPSRVSKWQQRFSIDVNLIPRTLFPGISMPLVFAKYTKTAQRRFSGIMLFAETRDIENMKPAIREALAQPGTWRQAVASALQTLGGEASLSAIYEAVTPERRTSTHWRPKIRQTLQRGFEPRGDGRWALPEDMKLAA